MAEEGRGAVTSSTAPNVGGPAWATAMRPAATDILADLDFPTTTLEEWRYSPIGSLSLDAFTPAPSPAGVEVPTLGEVAATIVLVDGFLLEASTLPDGVTLATLDDTALDANSSYFDVVHAGLTPARLVLTVEAGRTVETPIVVLSDLTGVDGRLSAPHLEVRVGRGADVSLIEVTRGGAATLTLASTSVILDDAARLRHVALQSSDLQAWYLARQVVTIGRDASFTSCTVGVGAAYDRLETEVTVTGSGGSSTLRNLYVGTGDQVHDVRTLQDHAAPHTTSDLLCTGAVADSAHSVFTGTIRIRNGAIRSNAAQTNHNLVLGEHARADSVPNLDILENDVSCSHGSTVGPVDEDQRYYLESRGVEPAVAERLLIAGFFADAVAALPVEAARSLVEDALGARLADLTEAVRRG